MSQTLSQFQWKNRVLLVVAPAPSDSTWLAQAALWQSDKAGLAERDLMIGRIEGDTCYWPDHQEAALPYLKRFGLPSDQFQVLLIGKDGGLKLRSLTLLTLDRLFATIDVMPMRRAEMRRK